MTTADIAAGPPPRTRRERPTLTAVITWVAAGCFVAVILGVLASVVVQSFATTWRGGWWPAGLTATWYGRAWSSTGMSQALANTAQAGVAVVVIALLAGVPAGYLLARRAFPGRSVVMLLMLLPIILPPMTYAVQLAALMYRVGLGGSMTAVVLVNLVPTLPLVVLIMVPFVEQISPEVENAARVFGANNLRLFSRVLVPLLLPGMLAAGILVLVRTLGAFELTFFVSAADTQTLVVALFGAISDPGGVPGPLTAAMAVTYMLVAVLGLAVSLRFVTPSQAIRQRHR
ncbi:ABC transporter permease [Pseudonocardia xinjiangensis]|uniref:ABC transporter permease subunit n=1 Tax=Pseudonocardia xinjiangensis TaxID=75289 RepID=A0ABX1RG27_9PSEU|nr:ABC transporter permease subunit [Pseudonocardia xinjiangensis]NMH78982.1 ABC transporter permease subunit [Pseudonocardia xinjiangensis]